MRGGKLYQTPSEAALRERARRDAEARRPAVDARLKEIAARQRELAQEGAAARRDFFTAAREDARLERATAAAHARADSDFAESHLEGSQTLADRGVAERARAAALESTARSMRARAEDAARRYQEVGAEHGRLEGERETLQRDEDRKRRADGAR